MKLILKVSNSYESLYNVSWNYKKLCCPFNQSKVFFAKILYDVTSCIYVCL